VGAQYLWVFSIALASPLAPKIFNRLKNFWKICVHQRWLSRKLCLKCDAVGLNDVSTFLRYVLAPTGQTSEWIVVAAGSCYLRSYLPTTPYQFLSNGNLQLKLQFYTL